MCGRTLISAIYLLPPALAVVRPVVGSRSGPADLLVGQLVGRAVVLLQPIAGIERAEPGEQGIGVEPSDYGGGGDFIDLLVTVDEAFDWRTCRLAT